MAAPVLIKNAIDAWTTQTAPTKNIPNTSKLHIQGGGSANKYAWLYFARPWPAGATIISAKLRVWNGDAWGSTTTLTAARASAKWALNRITYNNQPAVTGTTASLTLATAAAQTMWEIDVTALVQTVANGSAWYGFRLASTRTTDGWLFSTQSTFGQYRPVLEVTWSMASDQPDNLRPSGNRQVAVAKPYLSFDNNDSTGDTTLAAVQVQIAATQANADAGTSLTFDSGTVAASAPELDLSTTAYAGLTNLQTVWWRARTQDGAGVWSPWALSVQFGRTDKGTLAITSPAASPNNYLWEGSPTITWTWSGTTQRAYQVIIAATSDPNAWLWDSGKITSTATSVNVPFGIIKDASLTYRVTVRIWDTVDREATPGDTMYVEAFRDATVNYDGTVAPATSLAAVSDALLPVEHLTWSRSATPDYWQLQRSADGGATWTYQGEYLGSSLSTGGTNYAVDDFGAASYLSYQWRVVAIVGGRQSSTNPTVSGSVRRLAPFLMRPDGTDAVPFLNPARDRKNLNIQELHQTLDGSAVLITQAAVGPDSGTVSGRLTGDALSGITADTLAARFKRLRADSGKTMKLVVANEAFDVIAYDMQIDTITDSGGITYTASFSWFEV